MTNGNLVDWFREKFLGKTPTYVPPPKRFNVPTSRPVPVQQGPQGLPLNPAEQAALVSGGSHPKGRDSGAGLVGGR